MEFNMIEAIKGLISDENWWANMKIETIELGIHCILII